MSMKVAFSLKGGKSNKGSSSKSSKKGPIDGFEALHEEKPRQQQDQVHPDLKQPLVIPVQNDVRQSLQEQARAKREQQQKQEQPEAVLSKEDQAAIDALKKDASNDSSLDVSDNSKVIQALDNTFQGNNNEQNESEQFKEDLEKLAPDLSVDSESYQKVPIADFGAALLRGMGWTGAVDKSEAATSLPRPSRLGLGATPKLLDVPTHKKGRRRQDQVQRQKQLEEQQAEYERQRQEQIKKDKQRTIQVGSIVHVEDRRRRAIIRQWTGVPGLNMILVQFEGENEPSKVKKGSVHLVDRQELHENPFREPEFEKIQETKYVGERDARERHDHGRRHKEYDDRDDRRRGEKSKKRRHEDDDRRHRRSSGADERRKHKHDRDRDRRSRDSDGYHESKKRKKDDYDKSRSHGSEQRPSTWLIPSIRVRVITSKFGRTHDKQKGVVVDVTAKGTATLEMANGAILQVHEKYLETALPKVGGNACILTGNHRFAKGRLLERDSRANKGAIQLFEDMNIVTTSLDDMAEWCAPLDDDLME